MPELVALALPGGPGFVDALTRTWQDGDAVFVLDLRLPAPEQEHLLTAMAPARVWRAGGVESRRDPRPVDVGDAVVLATSGTTGAPKGAVLTHEAVRASAEATSARLEVDPDRDTWLACLPLAHAGGLSVVLRALALGTGLVVHDGFDADAVESAAAEGATLTSLVATALARIDASRFRRILIGGSAPPAELPDNVVPTYGLTETGSGVVYDGRPLDGVDVRIHDDEILLRGPMLLRCYRDGRDPKDADGWLPTGDLGRLEPDGRLVVEGRADALIKTGGEKVWPDPVAALLARHPKVADVHVVGRPDAEWGQRVVALVVPVDAHDPPSLTELREHVGERLPRYAAPREVELVDRIPRTALGKPVQR